MGSSFSSTVASPTPPATNSFQQTTRTSATSYSSARRSVPTDLNDLFIPSIRETRSTNSSNNKRHSRSSGRMVECSICIETFVERNFPRITKKCRHENRVCNSCINRHISSTLNDKGDANIHCPCEGCGQVLEHNDVKRVATNDLFERFDTLSLRQALREMPDFRWCKNATCGSGQIHYERDNAPIMTCRACGEKSCYTHDVPWHESQTCDEYEVFRQEQEAATVDYLQRETKPCPKCGVRIAKNGGCNHMTCKIKRCGYEFCWLCMADYNEIRKNGNKKHKPTCQFYG